jgi:hypothetical protein
MTLKGGYTPAVFKLRNCYNKVTDRFWQSGMALRRVIMKNRVWLIMIFLLGAACLCRTPSFLTPKPKVINHPAPALKVDTSPFQNIGCGVIPDYQPCEATSLLGELGCKSLRDAGPLLGGLSPAYPLAYCVSRYQSGENDQDPSLFHRACLAGQNYRLALYKDGQFQLVNDLAELQAAFAPIETTDEALSYALAATGLDPQFGYQVNSTFRYLTQQIEDTNVTSTGNDYLVHLFDSQVCGCGPHPFFSVDVTVTRDGKIEVGKRQPVSEDPKMDGMCID